MLLVHFKRKISEAANDNPRISRTQRQGKLKKRTEERERKEEID
jgi:hypothetical protein